MIFATPVFPEILFTSLLASAEADRPFYAPIFNPCETSEESGAGMMAFREKTQRRTANMIRCSLLIFTILYDFTLNAKIRCTLL